MIGGIVFAFGLLIGSFLNVCIRRIPARESIVLPASHCPACGAAIKPFDNIPVLSYLILRGRCRACRAPISPLYPAVELLTALLFTACYAAFGPTLEALKWAAFAALLLVLFFTDLRERILPDKINFTGIGLGLLLSVLTKPADGTALALANRMFDFPPPAAVLSFTDSVFGIAAGGGLLWIVAEGYFRLRKREGMGLGDVKMMAMAGAFLGLKRTILTILVGSLLGSLVGAAAIVLLRRDSKYELPFGSFLSAAALLVVFFGTPALNWYQSLFVAG